MAARLPIAILASGAGTNMQAIIEQTDSGRLPVEIRLLVCNRHGAGAIARAERHHIPVEVVDHRAFPDRESFDRRMVEVLRAAGVELVCLAGFDRLITATLIRAFPDRILNIHPALLPSFPGLHGQRQALEYGVRIAGCTVHFVDEKTDHGPIVIQAAVPVREGDTLESLSTRILVEEHRIYPEAIRLFAEGRLRVEGRHVRIVPEGLSDAGPLSNPKPR